MFWIRCVKLDLKKIKSNKNLTIGSMAAIRYIRLIRLIPTYIQPVVIRRMFAKFHQYSSKTVRQVCIETYRRTDGRTWLDRSPKSKYILMCRRRLLRGVENILSK